MIDVIILIIFIVLFSRVSRETIFRLAAQVVAAIARSPTQTQPSNIAMLLTRRIQPAQGGMP